MMTQRIYSSKEADCNARYQECFARITGKNESLCTIRRSDLPVASAAFPDTFHTGNALMSRQLFIPSPMSRPRDSTGSRPQIPMGRSQWPWSPRSQGHNISSSSSLPGASSGRPSSGSGFLGQGNWAGSHPSYTTVGSQSTATSDETSTTRHWTFTVRLAELL
jgi:hypothetical protein